MKDILLRFIFIIAGAILVALFLVSVAKHSIKTNYKYIDTEGNWGTSTNCYVEYDYLYCETNENVILVKQFYTEN